MFGPDVVIKKKAPCRNAQGVLVHTTTMKGTITLIVTYTIWDENTAGETPKSSRQHSLNVTKLTIDSLVDFNLDDPDARTPYEVRYTVVNDDKSLRLVALEEDVDYQWTVV